MLNHNSGICRRHPSRSRRRRACSETMFRFSIIARTFQEANGGAESATVSVCWTLLVLALLPGSSLPWGKAGRAARSSRQTATEQPPVWVHPGDLQLGVFLSLTAFHRDSLCGPVGPPPAPRHRLRSGGDQRAERPPPKRHARLRRHGRLLPGCGGSPESSALRPVDADVWCWW